MMKRSDGYPLVLGMMACLSTALAPAATGLDEQGQMAAAFAVTGEGFDYRRLENGVQFCVGGIFKNVLFYGPETIRVNASLGQAHTTQPSLTVVAQPANVPFKVKDSESGLRMISDRLTVVVDKQTGALTFQRPDGSILTRERAARPSEIKEVTLSGAPTYEVRQTFSLTEDESLYGLGQYNEPYMDYRGQKVKLVQSNIGIVVPFLISTRRYGILWDIYSKSLFTDDANGASFWAESAPAGVDYYFIAGENMDGVIAGYRQLTGAAPMFPKAAFGLFMSKERYPTQARLLEVARNFRRAGFPLDTMVQDWQYWGGDRDGTWSGMIWNKERFPDPAAMTRTLHDELNMKLMISIWPSVGNDTELARELDARGLRFAPLHWISGKARIYDAFSAEGREIYFKHIKKGLLDVGVDSLWMDGTEVEVGGACHNQDEVEADIKRLGTNAMGDFTRYLNPYSLMTTRGAYEGQRATGSKRVLTLTRSSWAGQQRYAALPWSGDTTASWKTLRNQISGGVNVCMAGQPYWTQDTGGFFVNYPGGEKNPEYRELYARWNQFAIFNPIYRIHGTSIEREPYLFKTLDPEIYQSLLDAAHLRYRLLPYIYSLGWRITDQGYTMMRGLPMDFPDDQKVRKLDDAFMFGPAFLVHPVTRAMYHVPIPAPGTIPPAAFETPEGKPGLAVQYFEGVNFDRPAGKVVEPKVDHTWPGPPLAEPPGGLRSCHDFSARWEAVLTMPEEGEYEIGAEGDDGVRLWLDGNLVVDDWGTHPLRWRGSKVRFTKGQRVALKIEFFQGGGERGLRMGWKTPSQLASEAANPPKLDNIVETYLPAAAGWYDFWTNERFAGGRTVKQEVPLDQLPLFVQAGSIVPMGPVMQYATEKPDAPYEIRVYPGADARFTLYDDGGEDYAYEKGDYATMPFVWDEKRQTLTIGKREGTFPGMVKERTFRVVRISTGSGVGAAPEEEPAAIVHYTGKAVKVPAPNSK